MALKVEIIDFTRPVANCKNLYVSNIKTNDLNEAQITSALYDEFSPFGLLFEIQVFPVKIQGFKSSGKFNDATPLFYAFVKFYSYHAAQRARFTLHNKVRIGTLPCKVTNAVRFKETDAGQPLYAGKCQELANHYLGFNGWRSSIRQLQQDKDESDLSTTVEEIQGPRVRFFCVVDLSFPRQGLSTQGIGAWEETYSLQDPHSKTEAIHKARKRCYQRAQEHAFARVLLVVMSRGAQEVKVTVEIDTTKVDNLTETMQMRLAEEQVLKVTELTEADDEDNDDDEERERKENNTSKMADNIDDVNLHILQELGDGCV